MPKKKLTPTTAKLRSDQFHKNIEKRGQVTENAKAKENAVPVGPYVLGFFLFVIVGSALLQIFRAEYALRVKFTKLLREVQT